MTNDQAPPAPTAAVVWLTILLVLMVGALYWWGMGAVLFFFLAIQTIGAIVACGAIVGTILGGNPAATLPCMIFGFIAILIGGYVPQWLGIL